MPIDKILEEWIGEEKPRKEYKPTDFLAHRADFNDGYNQALTDLKSRIPQIKERILGEIENEIKQINKCFTEIRTIENRKMKEAMNENKVFNASVINWCVTGERILHDLYFKNHTPQGGKE